MSAKPGFHQPACPDDALIANYADGLLSPWQRRSVERHLQRCSECRLLVGTVRDLSAHQRREGLAPVPKDVADWSRRFVSAVAKRHQLLDIVAAFTDRAVRAIQTTGTVLRGPAAQPAYAVRRASADRSRTVIVQQSLGSVRVQVQVTGMDRGLHAVSLRATAPRSRSSIDDMRATLVQGDMELESHPFRRGSVTFESLRPGRYAITLDHPALTGGVVFLQLLAS